MPAPQVSLSQTLKLSTPTAPDPQSFSAFAAGAKDGLSPEEIVAASLGTPGVTLDPQDILNIERQDGKRVLFTKLGLTEAANLDANNAEFAKRPRVSGVTLSIDDYETKDIDDALSYHREPDGTVVIGVHVADVSAWIRTGSALNFTARRRNRSSYTSNPRVVVPMFPVPLSEDLFSLKGGEDRLAKTVELRFTPDFTFKDFRILRTVFHNQNRLDINDAGAIRQGKGGSKPEVQEALQAMTRAAATLAGSPGAELGLHRVLETLIVCSCELVGRALAEAGIHTSFRHQAKAGQRSYYSDKPAPHATMGVGTYARWTSPIRRFTDLDVHRGLDRLLDNELPEGRVKELDDRLRHIEHERLNAERGDPSYDCISAVRALVMQKLQTSPLL